MKITSIQMGTAGRVALAIYSGDPSGEVYEHIGRKTLEFWAPILRDGLLDLCLDVESGFTQLIGEKTIQEFFDSVLAKPDPRVESVIRVLADAGAEFPSLNAASEAAYKVVAAVDAARKGGPE